MTTINLYLLNETGGRLLLEGSGRLIIDEESSNDLYTIQLKEINRQINVEELESIQVKEIDRQINIEELDSKINIEDLDRQIDVDGG